MAENEDSEAMLENHLHQQYAENDNKRSSVFTSFIVGIIALFGFYGFVYVNTNKREWNFDIQEFLLMSFITIGILFFLAILALYYGYALRRDQFIINKIREERYKKNGTDMKKIFGDLYSPFGKKCRDFIPDFYNFFYWLFFISEIFLGIISIIKVICIVFSNNLFCDCKNIICFMLFFISLIIFIFYTLKFRCRYFDRYEEKQLQVPKKCGDSKDCSSRE